MEYNIASYHRHLGDELQFSTLPEILHKKGHKVRLYEGPDVLEYSNDGIKRFVWGYNPFVDEVNVSKENWNAGDLPSIKYENLTGSFISNWEKLHGLEPENILPKIYYIPRDRAETEEKHGKIEGIIEISGITLRNDYVMERVWFAIEKIIKNKPGIKFRQIVNSSQSSPSINPYIDIVKPDSLEDISDIIHNCKVFISLASGLHSLAAAISRFDNNFTQYCFLPESKYDYYINSKLFIYPNIIYLPI